MKNDINLLTLRKYAAETGKNRSFVLFAILFATLLLAGIVLPERARSEAKQKLSGLEHTLSFATVTQESLDEKMRNAAHIGSQLSDLDILYASRSDILLYLSAIEKSRPITVDIASLSFSGNLLNIHGTAPDDMTVATFCQNLRDTGPFASVLLEGSA